MRRSQAVLLLAIALFGCKNEPPCAAPPCPGVPQTMHDSIQPERQLTRDARGHILTNTAAWSPDGRWIVYDTRSDPAGEMFDGDTIERVNVATGQVQVLYRSQRGAHCGVATYSPVEDKVVFILGPQDPTPDWQYGPYHRQGAIVDAAHPGVAINLDARDLVAPFTPGALRGGSHVHVFSPDGRCVSFTYEDAVLARFDQPSPEHDVNQRNVAVSVTGRPVTVGHGHPHNHDGTAFSVLVTRTTASPRPGSDEISKAFEEGWVGAHGYVRADGSRQKRALAFQGHVRTAAGQTIAEVFIVDLPDDLTHPGNSPLQGTVVCAPAPPRGVVQRRLTFTADRAFPGIQGPRHWLRSAPDGSRIAFLMKNDAGVPQLWTVSPNGGAPTPLTRGPHGVASSFTWSPDGGFLACVIDHSVCRVDATTGQIIRLTAHSDESPRPEACVVSPDGSQIAYVRRAQTTVGQIFNQVFVVAAR